jgi:hypothetical protein
MLGAGVDNFSHIIKSLSNVLLSLSIRMNLSITQKIILIFVSGQSLKALWAKWAGMAEALLRAFGWSVGSWRLANVLTTMGRIFMF